MRRTIVFKNGLKLWPVFCAETFLQKARGLMFKRKATPLLFEFDSQATARNAIHSFFCPVFDAVFLDSRKCIVCIIARVAPSQPFLHSSKPAKFLLELPPGEARKVRVGEKLSWNPGEPGRWKKA
ncbi:DUF192 domain-containing protein [Candidatus Micrarchaeota archaeon]|nr:DUF192 domain-containing protein [Candidatus Micrarchaeota archaeon]